MFPAPAPALHLPGWYHLVGFGVILPLFAIRTWFRVRDPSLPLPPRIQHFKGAALTLVVLGGTSLLVAHAEWITLFPREWPPLSAIVAGVATYVVMVLAMRPFWRRAVVRRKRIVALFMPANGIERAWWIFVALLAGVSEEMSWRGVQTALLLSVTQDYGIAIALSALAFAIAHAVQGWKSMGVILLFALTFHGLTWVTGSLYVAIVVHAMYDVTAGLTYGRLGRELGWQP